MFLTALVTKPALSALLWEANVLGEECRIPPSDFFFICHSSLEEPAGPFVVLTV